MNNGSRVVCVCLLLGAGSVQAAQRWVTAEVSHTNYTNGFGERNVRTAEFGHRFGANTIILKALSGSRDYDNGASFNDAGLSGTLYRDWNPRLTTRSALAHSKDEPVFANRLLDQEFSYKLFNRTLVSAGAKHTAYAGEVNSNAVYASAAYYFDRVMVRYRYTHDHLSGIGNSYGHLLSVRLKDQQGAGATQMWLAQGTSVQEYDWIPATQKGDFTSVALRRAQPVSQYLTLNLGLAQSWYDTPVAEYKGLMGNVGVTYRW